MSHLLYGIVRSGAASQPGLTNLESVAPVRLISEGGLAAVVSAAADAAARRPAPWIHARAIQALHEVRTVLPMRHGTSFETEADVRDYLRRNAGAFHAALDRLDGCAEMGVRVICDSAISSPVSASASLPAAALSPARAYLAARQGHYAAQDAASAEVSQAGRRMEESFHGLFTESRTETSFANGCQILSLHYLVRRDDVERFRDAFRRLEGRSVEKILLTGPWPPYNFVAFADVESLPESGAGSIAGGKLPEAPAHSSHDSALCAGALRDSEFIADDGMTLA